MMGFDDNGSMMGGDDDDMSMMDDPGNQGQPGGGAGTVNKGGRGRKKDNGETEEEKRKNFLERNRQGKLPYFTYFYALRRLLTLDLHACSRPQMSSKKESVASIFTNQS